MSKPISNVLQRRRDLSPVLVHLTRTCTLDGEGTAQTACERLKQILIGGSIRAFTPMGLAARVVKDAPTSKPYSSQKVVCFTEAPLEHVADLCGDIAGRRCSFEPFGIAITRTAARKEGINPVWYIDITPGHDWLTKAVDALVKNGGRMFHHRPIARLTPFFETMGSGTTRHGRCYKKEFWWEREWRHVGDLPLSRITPFLILCPRKYTNEFRLLLRDPEISYRALVVDPSNSPGTLRRRLRRNSRFRPFTELVVGA